MEQLLHDLLGSTPAPFDFRAERFQYYEVNQSITVYAAYFPNDDGSAGEWLVRSYTYENGPIIMLNTILRKGSVE